MKMMPILESERLFVRPFTLDDLPAIHQILDIGRVDSAGEFSPLVTMDPE